MKIKTERTELIDHIVTSTLYWSTPDGIHECANIWEGDTKSAFEDAIEHVNTYHSGNEPITELERQIAWKQIQDELKVRSSRR